MISSGNRSEIKILDTTIRVDRVWGSGVRTCGSYWIGLEKVAYFVLPGFGYPPMDHGRAVVLVGGREVLDEKVSQMNQAMSMIEGELKQIIGMDAYGKESLKNFQASKYFNRGEMPVNFEFEKVNAGGA